MRREKVLNSTPYAAPRPTIPTPWRPNPPSKSTTSSSRKPHPEHPPAMVPAEGTLHVAKDELVHRCRIRVLVWYCCSQCGGPCTFADASFQGPRRIPGTVAGDAAAAARLLAYPCLRGTGPCCWCAVFHSHRHRRSHSQPAWQPRQRGTRAPTQAASSAWWQEPTRWCDQHKPRVRTWNAAPQQHGVGCARDHHTNPRPGDGSETHTS